MSGPDYLTLICGDALEELRLLPAGSARCCVTSPPYWGLRDYGFEGQIGLERTPEEYVEKMVELFREVRRVLTDDGSLWLNLGDCYANAAQCGGGDPTINSRNLGGARYPNLPIPGGLKPKDLVGIPWRVAFALQADGWWLRAENIWHKPNPMPESVKDRTTRAHEQIFHLTKSARYFYDHEAIKEPPSEALLKQIEDGYNGENSKDFESAGAQGASDVKKRIIAGARERAGWNGSDFDSGKTGEMKRTRGGRHTNGKHAKQPKQSSGHRMVENVAKGREAGGAHDNPFGLGANKRSVWTVTTKPFPGAHFATFPPDLILPCVLAGSEKGDRVIDPFAGSGTTGQVALENGRRAILIEGNPEYVPLIEERCRVQVGLGL